MSAKHFVAIMGMSLCVMIIISTKKHTIRISLVFNGECGKRPIVMVATQRGGAMISCKKTQADTVSVNFSYRI